MGPCLPAIDLNATDMDSLLAGTKTKFARLEEQMTQVRRRGSVENPGQSHTNVIRECGIAMNLVTLDIGLGDEREAVVARLAHGIYDDALLLHLRLHIIPIRWLPQLDGDEQKMILEGVQVEQIRTVRGIAIHGCLNTRSTAIRYNRV